MFGIVSGKKPHIDQACAELSSHDGARTADAKLVR